MARLSWAYIRRGTKGRDGHRLLRPVHFLRDAFATVTATTPPRLLDAGGEVLCDE